MFVARRDGRLTTREPATAAGALRSAREWQQRRAVRPLDVHATRPTPVPMSMTLRLSPLVLGALCLAAAPALRAQAPAPRAITFGLIGGLSSATLAVDDDGGEDDDTERRNGLAGGAYLTFGIAPQLGLRAEVLYAMKGARANGSDDVGDPEEVTVKLDYVEVPLLLQFQPAVAGGLRPRLYAGPAFAFRARCRFEIEDGDASVTTDCDALDGARENIFKSRDVGGMVGGELAFGGATGPGFAVGVRYTHGFTNIGDAGDATIRNRVLGLYGSVEFPIGR
jgi:hypothetical protein